jgi:hypothetical protein
MRRRPLESRTRRALVTLTALVALATAAESYAGPTPAQQCQSGKNKAAGKYAACRGNAEAKLATSRDATKYGEAIIKCADKFAAAWQKLEDKAVAAGSACPSVGDATDIDGKVTETTDTIAALVGGARFPTPTPTQTPPLLCGDSSAPACNGACPTDAGDCDLVEGACRCVGGFPFPTPTATP